MTEQLDEKIKAYVKHQTEIKENFIAIYLQKTGYKIEDIVLIEQHDGNLIRWWCELRNTVNVPAENTEA